MQVFAIERCIWGMTPLNTVPCGNCEAFCPEFGWIHLKLLFHYTSCPVHVTCLHVFLVSIQTETSWTDGECKLGVLRHVRTSVNIKMLKQDYFWSEWDKNRSMHICMSTPKLHFQDQNSPKSRLNAVKFSGIHQQTYPHIYEINPAARFYGKITGQSTLPIPRSWECCFCWSRLIVRQCNHFKTVLQTSRKCHLSSQWWWKVTSHGMLS